MIKEDHRTFEHLDTTGKRVLSARWQQLLKYDRTVSTVFAHDRKSPAALIDDISTQNAKDTMAKTFKFR